MDFLYLQSLYCFRTAGLTTVVSYPGIQPGKYMYIFVHVWSLIRVRVYVKMWLNPIPVVDVHIYIHTYSYLSSSLDEVAMVLGVDCYHIFNNVGLHIQYMEQGRQRTS